MIWLLYMSMIIGIPIIFCILLHRLRERIPEGHIIVPILMAILILRTIIFFPIYIFAPVISDSSYEFFKTCLLVLMQFSIYGIIIICLYIASYILIKKEKRFTIFIITVTVIFILLIYFIGGTIFREREKPDELYLKMEEINTNNSLIGLSKEEVVERLGEPTNMYQYSNMDKEVYTYGGGNIYVGIIWGNHNIVTTRHWYIFSVDFDKTDKVKSTSMREST